MSAKGENDMARLLHIQASPRGEDSFSSRVGEAFCNAYQQAHSGDKLDTLDLWTANLPEFDQTAAAGKYKVMRNLPHNSAEAAAWQRVIETIEHFKSFDKYLLSAPMWNFGIPHRLKQYIDTLVQPGLTFSFSPQAGYRGLVTDRRLQLILARGGEYAPGTPTANMDHQRPYLETIFGFIGFTDIRTLVVEPTMGPGAEAKLANAISQAEHAAAPF